MKRRQFLGRSSALLGASVAPTIIPSSVFGQSAPSKQITLGFIGMGGQGIRMNLQWFLNTPNTRTLAVCDCMMGRALEAKKMVDEKAGNSDCDVYQDFREVINRDDIDAIVISTPDHWHVPMSLMALRAGKHVFCEKPTLTITEGHEVVDEALKRDLVFQWGIEDRHMQKYWILAGLARTGAIGEVEKVECGLPNKPLFDVEAPAPIPEDLDWNLWLGPAPEVEYTPKVTHGQRWRQSIDYSGGSLTDWGSHYCDSAQIAIGMEESGPIEVVGTSKTLPDSSYVSVPSSYDVEFRYANGKVIQASDTLGRNYIRFIGSEGWIGCEKWNGQLVASDMNLFRNKDFPNHENYWKQPKKEQPEFIDAILDRSKTTSYHVDAGHKLSTMLHLGHMAVRSGTPIQWDPDKQQFAQDREKHEASIIYSRESRDWEKSS
ncbi:MAG: Gfo/Idh/MocA family oxidoreductase [Planctomycetota bacterium]